MHFEVEIEVQELIMPIEQLGTEIEIQGLNKPMKRYSVTPTMRRVILILISLFTAFVLHAGSDALVKAYSSNLPFQMPEIQLPDIPGNRVSIVEFGAVGDGNTMNSDAIAAAIHACSTKGGGVVVVPPGMWLTGPIRFESNIELHVDSGAVILFSKRFEDYPMFARPKSSVKCVPMIYGSSLENIAITGKGLFDGNGQYWRPVKKEKMTDRQWKQLLASGGAVTPDGKMWWPSKEAMNGQEYLKNLKKVNKKLSPEDYAAAREFLRPVMVAFDNCKRVLFDGPTFANSPAWALVPTSCEDVVIRNITVNNPWWGQNTDGLDINSCRNVLLYSSVVTAGDDGICLKPARLSEMHPGEPACENIVVADCIVYHGHGGFVIGSESYGGARNISVKNCTFVGTDIGLRFKSAKERGGVIEKVYVDGIRMKDIANEAILFDMFYDSNGDVETANDRLPQYRDFHLRNIVCDGASQALFIRGLEDMPVKDIHFENISINSDRACFLQDAEGIDVSGLRVSMKEGPVWTMSRARHIQLSGISFSNDAPVFLKVDGGTSSDIVFSKSDASKAKLDVELGAEVKKESVVGK